MDLVSVSTEDADHVARYRAASEAGDLAGMTAALAPDVELVSPISGRLVFRGPDDVRAVLGAVVESIADVRWTHEAAGERRRVVMGEAAVGPFHMTDAMVLELDAQGRIRRLTPHLRPWLALTLLALRLGIRLARRPGVLRRAMRAG